MNERATLGHMFKWGLEQGFFTRSQLPVWSEIKNTISYRKALQRDGYRVLYTYLNKWRKNIVDDERSEYERQLCRDFILILANTGMRFGEARFLKLNYVEVKNSLKSKYPNVQIRIPAEI